MQNENIVIPNYRIHVSSIHYNVADYNNAHILCLRTLIFVCIQFALRIYVFLMKLGNKQQLIAESVLADDTCQTRDPVFAENEVR